MSRSSLFARRAMLAAFDAFALTVICATFIFALPDRAFAYVDPSVMTYTIQALAGVAVALSAVLGVVLRKTRKFLFRKLGIDENAGKEVDPAWFRKGEEGSVDSCRSASVVRAGYAKRGQLGAAAKADSGVGTPSWLKRFVLSLIVVGFCGFTLGMVAPYEIVAGSAGSLLFELSDIAAVMAIPVIVAVLLFSLVLSLIPKKAFGYCLALTFAFGLCCYIQAMFLNAGLPAADGSTVNWDDHGVMMVVSAVAWILLFAAFVLMARFSQSTTQVVAAVLSISLVVVQSVGVASLFLSDQSTVEGGAIEVTEDGLFEVSDKSNVIVFILDYFDTRTMDQLLNEDPKSIGYLADFTYYHNSAGVMLPTDFSVPYLLTQQLPQIDEEIADYRQERYSRSSFLESIAEQNYSVGLYSNNFGTECLSDESLQHDLADYTINMHGLDDFSVNEIEAFKILMKCALYRDMPWVVKWRFWFYTDQVNQRVVDFSAEGSPENTVYVLDDPNYYAKLQDFGLSVEDGNYDGAFRFIHLNGPHFPYTMDENAQYVGVDETTHMQQVRGSLHIVNSYLQKLDDMGLYDGATIIVTSDHGNWQASLDLPTDCSSPIMFMKKSFASNEQDDGSLGISNSPISHANLHATILEAVGGDASGFGDAIDEVSEVDRVRDTHMVTSDGNYVLGVLKYTISGDVLDFSTWSYTGESWVVER